MLTNYQRQKFCEAAASRSWNQITLAAWAKEEFRLGRLAAINLLRYPILNYKILVFYKLIIKKKEFRYKARDKLLQFYCLDTFTGPIYSAFGHFS